MPDSAAVDVGSPAPAERGSAPPVSEPRLPPTTAAPGVAASRLPEPDPPERGAENVAAEVVPIIPPPPESGRAAVPSLAPLLLTGAHGGIDAPSPPVVLPPPAPLSPPQEPPPAPPITVVPPLQRLLAEMALGEAANRNGRLVTESGLPLLRTWGAAASGGFRAAFAVSVAGPSAATTAPESSGSGPGLSLQVLSNPQRAATAEPLELRLHSFVPSNGQAFTLDERPIAAAATDLGDWPVLDAVSVVPIDARPPGTIAVEVQVHDAERSARIWVVFRASGWTPLDRLVLEESVKTSTLVADIDSDGVADVMVADREPVEGTGYETLLTWYRWRERRFVPVESVPVVERLAGFLGDVARLLVDGSVEELTRVCLADDGTVYTPAENAERLVVALGLTPLLDEALTAEALIGSIRNARMPIFFENPFPLESRPSGATIRYRVIDDRGRAVIATSTVIMAANPFGDQMYYFQAPEGAQ